MSRPKMMQCLAHPPPTSPRILRKIATPFPTPLGCTDALENKTKHPGCLSPGVIRRVHVTATPPRQRRRDITLSKQSPLVAMVSPMTSRRDYSAASSTVVSQNGSGNHLDYEEYMKSRQDRTNKDRFQHLQPFSEMPGPRGLPMIGTLWDYMKKDGYTFGKMFEVMTQRAAEYGPVYREQIADRLHVVVSDLDEYHKVIAVDGRFPHRIELEPFAHFRRQRGMSLGTVNSQGDEWYRHRKVVSKKTLRPKEVLAYCEPMNGVADDLIVNLTDKLGKNGEVKDIERELFKWALESVGTVIFEERIGSFDQPPSKMSVQFLDNLIGFFNNMQPLMYNAPIYKYWATPTWKTFEGHADKVVEAGMHFINKKVQTLQSSAQRDTGDNVHLLTYLLSQSSLTPSEALSHALDLMTGGVETTSNGVLWTLYLLSKHPETQKALRNELEEVLPNNEAIDETSLPNLPYIKACLKETFRIYPITFATSRIINQDIELGGFHIPTGTHVQANLYGMGHNPKFFPNPEQYEPERWLRDNNDMDPALQAFSHLPWGHGPRMCIGRRLAEQEIYIATSKIVRAFDVEYVGPPIEPVLKTVMTPDKPMQFKLTPRKKQNSYEWKKGLSQSEGTGLTM